jgi:hypothetical protein
MRTRESVQRSFLIGFAVLALAIALAGVALAGPPFLTDDPEPVPFGHWEVYGAMQWGGDAHAFSGTCPHIEVNYGPRPGLQLHLIVPAVLMKTRVEAAHYGLGDLELGAKLRFLDEGARHPQIGMFPLIFVPTGSEERGLGTGRVEALLPVWLQKSFGPWTTYGGGGIHLAAGENTTVAGWLVQRELAKGLTFGTEAFVTIPFSGDRTQTQLNAGLVIDLSDRRHLLLSAGPSFGADDQWQAYLAFLWTS